MVTFPYKPSTPYRTPLLKANQAFDIMSGGSSVAPNMSTQPNMSVAPNMTPLPTAAPAATAPAARPSTPTPSTPTPATPTGQESAPNPFIEASNTLRGVLGRNPKVNEVNEYMRTGVVSPSWANPTPAFPAGNINSSIVEDPGAEKAALESELAAARANTDQIVNLSPAGFTEGTFAQTDTGQMILSELQRLGVGDPTYDEAAIRAAGEAAAAQFEPLIAGATQSAAENRGKNLARAATAGQLDTTAVAGIAALTGNENIGLPNARKFEGTGGMLAKLGSEYDLQISQLKAAQISARRAAEEAERTFQRTGRQEDFNRAQQLYTLAEKAYSEQNTLAEQKQLALQRATQTALNQQTLQFGAEDRMLGQLAPGLVDVDAEGNVVRADDATIAQVAQQYGISPEALGAAVNNRIDELEGIQAERRQEALDAIKTQAEIGATGALEAQRLASAEETMRMLPLNEQLKQAQIASQQASAARTRQLMQKATEEAASLTSDDIANAIFTGIDPSKFKGVDAQVFNEGIVKAATNAPRTYVDYAEQMLGKTMEVRPVTGIDENTLEETIEHAWVIDPITREVAVDPKTGELMDLLNTVPYKEWTDFDARVRNSLSLPKPE